MPSRNQDPTMVDPKIRKANELDSRGIAQVHFQSWNETYKGLMPDAILDQTTLEYAMRSKEKWEEAE